METYRHAERTDGETGLQVIRRARDLLWHSAYSELRRVTSSYHRGVLILQGRVSSRYIKQVAQELMGRIQGVHSVINDIEVRAALESGRKREGAEMAIRDHTATPVAPGCGDSSEKG